jgi:hypothetical protein
VSNNTRGTKSPYRKSYSKPNLEKSYSKPTLDSGPNKPVKGTISKTPTRTKSLLKKEKFSIGAKSQASAPPEMTLEEIEAAQLLMMDKDYL